MNLSIRNKNTGKTVFATFPCEEKNIQYLCDQLQLPNAANTEIEVYQVSNSEIANGVLQGKTFKMDELNYLFARLDSFNEFEMNTFYAVVYAKKLESAKDFINLTFNTNCYSVLGSFENLNQVGKELSMNEQGSMAMDEYDTFDGQRYVEEMIASQHNPLLSPYGFVYPNRNEPQDLYFGKTLPQYLNGGKVFNIALRTDTSEEYLDLPCEDSAIQKALERLDAESLENTSVTILYHNLPSNIEEILYEIENDVQRLNDMAQTLEEVGGRESSHLEKLARYTKVSTTEELQTLCRCMHEFELFPNIRTPEAYGQYMICDSGHYEYDENLEEYIDFKSYGENRIANEVGTFTPQGYITYMGYNPKMIDILNEKLGMNIQSREYSETLRLYMPLKVITYEQENDWGQYETSDYEEELDSTELCGYEDELEDFITSYGDHVPEQRGLMEYYDGKDSVNAKVESFKFEFEQMDRDVYGVAVCQLKAPLDQKELALLKEYITGQAADGFGEGLEQQEFKLNGRDVNISLWDSNRYFLKTADEMGFREQSQGFEMSMN